MRVSSGSDEKRADLHLTDDSLEALVRLQGDELCVLIADVAELPAVLGPQRRVAETAGGIGMFT